MSGLIKCFSLSREEFTTLQEENNHYKVKLDRLEVCNSHLQAELGALRTLVDSEDDSTKLIVQQSELVFGKYHRCIQDLELMVSSSNDLTRSISQKCLKSQKPKLALLKQELSSLQNVVQEITQCVDTDERERVLCNEKIDELEQQLRDSQERLEITKHTLEDKLEENESLNAAIESAQKSQRDLKEEIRAMEHKLEVRNQAKEQAFKVLNKFLKDAFNLVVTENDDLEKIATRLSEIMNRLHKKIRSLQNEVRDSRNESNYRINTVYAQLENVSASLYTMQKELNTSLQYEDVELCLKLEEVMNQVKSIMKNLVPMTEERETNYEENTLVNALPGLILLLGLLCALLKNFVI